MATATTATADPAPARPASGPYMGRFAPSPTGKLHVGSLTTALGSALEAHAHGGRWRLRIEDLDTPRIRPGATDEMTRTLEALGFIWDGPIVFQSQRQAAYLRALEQLRAAGRIYPCGCSRRQLQEQLPDPEQEGGYPGTCRNGPSGPPPWAWRFRVRDEVTHRLEDGLQGTLQWTLQTIGDAVIQRRDGVIAYQLAVVVDDAEAGVSDVVRGADLLASTAWQLELQSALSLPQPRYLHLPLVVAADGNKLSKSAAAIPLDPTQAGTWLHRGLTLLQQAPPADLRRAKPSEIWQWAREHWDVTRLRGIRAVREDGSVVDAY